ncbi:hypothetical protein PRtIB026_A34960 [Pseudomonas sp. RtIB026]|uniref:hypothetical protein n=1 Tax=Pseudomonas sp. RtIB026 TaxID=2749999 RepID=UPI00226FE7D0|nr:hypothetical protein [Pseudomonas sp. RtIB026]BDU09906.1 hypothetical protein PRtIB026_A34960 [Pseudomonas sp. RtIB026]
MDITYKLPHPVRINCSEYAELNTQAMDRLYDEVFVGLDIESCSIDYLTQTVMRSRPEIFALHRSANTTDHMAGIALSTTLYSYKFRRQDGNILTTSNVLDEVLEQTEIGDDVPVDYLRPPFKTCYIEFTEDRSSSLSVYNELTHEHILEGVYISETQIEPGTQEMERYVGSPVVDVTKSLRILDLMFTGSPLGKAHVEDDALRVQGFYIQDGMRTIKQELSRVEEKYGADADFAGDIQYLSQTLNHMAKVLLFINCKQYRDTAFNERKELRKKINSLKGLGKIRKFENKLRKTYDRVVISPVDNVVYESDVGVDHSRQVREKRTHWRKGHFRMQPYGPGASKRKILFIEPTVVGGVFAKKKSYDVREKQPV